MEATHSRLIYYIRGDKEFQGEPERVYGANWAKTGSKWAYNPIFVKAEVRLIRKAHIPSGMTPRTGCRGPQICVYSYCYRV